MSFATLSRAAFLPLNALEKLPESTKQSILKMPLHKTKTFFVVSAAVTGATYATITGVSTGILGKVTDKVTGNKDPKANRTYSWAKKGAILGGTIGVIHGLFLASVMFIAKGLEHSFNYS